MKFFFAASASLFACSTGRQTSGPGRGADGAQSTR